MHAAFRSFKLLSAAPTPVNGCESVQCDGGLTYRAPDCSRPSAWVGGYYGEDRIAEPAAPWANRWQTWDRGRLQSFAESIKARVLILNIEHYGDDGLGRQIDLIETLRSFRPEIAFGVWSLLPASEWWTVQNYAQYLDWQADHPHLTQATSWWKRVGPARVDAFEGWRARNRLNARKLLPHVDALFPQIYPVYDLAKAGDDWKLARNVELVTDDSIAIANGLPVIPVYWPVVADTKRPASEALTRALTGAAIERGADGLLLWGDSATPAAALEKSAVIAREMATEHASSAS